MQEPAITSAIGTEAAIPADDQAPKSNKSALMIVFLVVFIDLLGFGIVLPLLPRFADDNVEALIPGGKDVAMGGFIIGMLMSSFSLMQFLFAPVWGRVSDRVGRRPILLLGLTGSVVFYSLLGYALSIPPEQAPLTALVLLFTARIGAGIAGATIATAQAVIADCTPPEKRKHGMAMIGAAFGIGFTFGPLFGFASLSWFPKNHELVGYTAAALSLLALVLGLRLLPETRKFQEAPPSKRRLLNWSALRWALGSPAIGPVILTFFLATLGFGAFEVTLAILLKDALGLAEGRTFLVFAYVGFVLMLTQGFLYRKLARRVSETTFMAMGIGLMAIGVAALGGLCWLALAEQARAFPAPAAGIAGQLGGGLGLEWAGALPAVMGGFSVARGYLVILLLVAITAAVIGFAFLTPSAQALVSRRTDADRQGEILGVNQSAAAMARILGPILGVTLYKATPSHMLPYFFGALLLVVMLPLIPRIKRAGEHPPT
jgi:MFS family permease